MRGSSEGMARKNSGETPMPGTLTYPEFVCGFLRERFSPLRHAEKLLARAARVSPRTAENWLRGQCAPQGEALLNLMAECDGLAELILAEAKARKETR